MSGTTFTRGVLCHSVQQAFHASDRRSRDVASSLSTGGQSTSGVPDDVMNKLAWEGSAQANGRHGDHFRGRRERMTAEEITVGGEGLFQIEQGEHGYGVYVGGKPLYEKVGGECDTCGGWFSLVDGPARPCTPADLSKRLGSGLDRVDRAIIDSFALLLPKGRYAVGLLRAIPFQRGDNERHWFVQL